ncbi:MAG: 3-dehydroquinate synthase [Eubacterium sp.]|jgi:3-dehydroquinate synthase
MPEFQVELKKTVDDSYTIEIGQHLAQQLADDLAGGLAGRVSKFAVITDSEVEPLYAAPIAAELTKRGMKNDTFVIPAGEQSKTREMKAELEDQMLAAGYRRDCCVIAAGGGVVTDLAGFLAGTYGRGVPFVNYATTLLAAADASVGGKTAVDTPLATNLIGLFYQPKKVYIDLAAWSTLPKRQICSGLAETIKHACLADSAFFEYLEAHMEDLLRLDPDACLHIAEENCRIKYQVVMQDEKETSGLREVLNLGHTVGRAIETVSGYRLLHGEAVAIGLAAQARLAAELGFMSEAEEARVTELLRRAQLPVQIPEYIDRETLVKKLYTDKKVRDGRIRFVLEKGIGSVMRFADGSYSLPVTEEQARRIINEI